MGQGGRPVGEVRAAVASAVRELRQAGEVVHFRAVAQAACVGRDDARQVLRDLARAGSVAPVGTTRLPGVCRPVLVYDLADMGEGDAVQPTPSSVIDLANVLGAWVDLG